MKKIDRIKTGKAVFSLKALFVFVITIVLLAGVMPAAQAASAPDAYGYTYTDSGEPGGPTYS